MIFDKFFEIGLLILGLLYVGDLYLDSIIELVRVNHEIEEEDDDKKHDEELKELSKHLYS